MRTDLSQYPSTLFSRCTDGDWVADRSDLERHTGEPWHFPQVLEIVDTLTGGCAIVCLDRLDGYDRRGPQNWVYLGGDGVTVRVIND